MTSETRAGTSVKLEASDLVASISGITEDIEALVVTALMEAAESCREDLKSIMNSVRAINKAKAHQREILGKMQRDAAAAAVAEAEGRPIELSKNGLGGVSAYAKVQLAIPDPSVAGGVQIATVSFADKRVVRRAEIEAAKDAIRDQLDSMSEMGEMESLRLQMAMDRLSKMMSTLSNILKKISDTSQAITQNLK